MSKYAFIANQGTYLLTSGGGAGEGNPYEYVPFGDMWPYWQTYEITHLHNNTIARNIDADIEVNSSVVIPRPMNVGVTSCTIRYGQLGKLDWILIREYDPIEPTWDSFYAEEAYCYPLTSYPSSITDGILLMNSTNVTFNHIGLNFGTGYCYSAWSYNHSYSTWSNKFDRCAVTDGNKLPIINNVEPSDESSGVSADLDKVQVDILDIENDPIYWEIFTSSGDYENGSITESSTITCLISPLEIFTEYDWGVNLFDGYDWNNQTFTFNTGPNAMPWWNSSWEYRKIVMIDSIKVEGDHENFPVLISVEEDSDLALKCQEKGEDIVFTDVNGEKLNHEIEYFDNITGQLIVWVNVTYLSNTEDTILYLYYGNPYSVNMENIVGVWDSNFKIIQHLNESSGTFEDSTIYNNDGSLFDADHDSNMGEIGIIGRCIEFNGDSDYINCGSDNSLDTPHEVTVEAWIKTLDIDATIASKYTYSSDGRDVNVVLI